MGQLVSMSGSAWMFPGQGSQIIGMGKDVYDRGPRSARFIFEEAEDLLRIPLKKMMFEGPLDELTLTYNAQPALLTVSTALAHVVREECWDEPVVCLGHSLGEYSALVAAGILSFPDAIKLVRARGTYMQDAVPAGFGAMSAILGCQDADVEKVCSEISYQSQEIVQPANYNAPGQIVVSGHVEAVKKVPLRLQDLSLKVKAIPLNVSAPFHCQLMVPAMEKMMPLIAQSNFRNSKIPIICNVSAEIENSPEVLKRLLTEQIVKSVKWTQSVAFAVKNLEIESFIEIGSGKVLAGLAKKVCTTEKLLSLSNVDDIVKLKT